MAGLFKYGHSAASQWRDATQACLAQMGEIPATANLGFLYVTDILAVHLQDILSMLKEATGVPHWVGQHRPGYLQCRAGIS